MYQNDVNQAKFIHKYTWNIDQYVAGVYENDPARRNETDPMQTIDFNVNFVV